MSKSITIIQEYSIELPKEYDRLSDSDIIDKLNKIYEISGPDIIKTTSAEYIGTIATHIDNKEVYFNIDKVDNISSPNSNKKIFKLTGEISNNSGISILLGSGQIYGDY
jgi:hypothetical protein